MTLAEMLKKYMYEHDLTYEEFARRCGLTKGYISMLVNNKNPKTGKPPVPKIETYDRIAKCFGMSLDDLFRTMDDAPVQIGKTQEELNEQPAKRKWRILSAGALTLSDEQLDKLYMIAHTLYPDDFPIEDMRGDDDDT